MIHCLLTVFLLTTLVSAQAPIWVKRAPKSPFFRAQNQLTLSYHEQDKMVYGFGVASSSFETWAWNGSQWVFQGKDGPRGFYRRMVYDSKRNRLVLYTGGATFEWIGGKWVTQSVASPTATSNFEMVFDSRRSVTVLFGGGPGPFLSEVWEYDGSSWTKRSVGGPAGRWRHRMAFDEANGETLLFGGEGSRFNEVFGDLWAWNGSRWQKLASAGPPGWRSQPALSYDPHKKRLIMFGGHRAGSSPGDDTWEWDGSQWSPIATAINPGRTLGIMAFDRSRRVALMHMDTSGDAATWEYLPDPQPGASFTPFGNSCPTPTGTPALRPQAGSAPRVGSTFSLEVAPLPSSFSPVMGLIGTSNVTWGSISLPLDLGIVGMPGCNLYISHEFTPRGLPINNKTANWDFTIPYDPGLIGGTFYLQAVVFSPGVNPFGAVMTNAGTGKLGY